MCKVLVVDDNPDILTVLETILTLNGFQVVALSKGGEVYDSVFLLEPKVVLMDVNLGTHDGRNICMDIKSKTETKKANVILLSANHNLKQSAFESLADDFIEKPFDINHLVNKVKGFCN